MKRIAVFHNAMDNIGGAEIVGLTLARAFGADIYSTNVDSDKIDKMGFSDISIRTIGQIPLNAPFRQQAALWKFRHLKLNTPYDFYLIDGDWAMSAGRHHRPNLWYVHSPMREIWDLYEYTRQHTVPWFARWIFDGWVRANRYLNRKYIQDIDLIACNSKNTQERIRKYLHRPAAVVYPPIDTQSFTYKENGRFWLSVNRLITHKRVEMQLEAFRRMPHERLIIVGSYERSRHFRRYAAAIIKNKPANVEVLSWVDKSQLMELYATCKGFITTAKDEDFGMTALEAQAAGKPVIAPNEGGYRETVLQGVTGVLIDDINPAKVCDAVKHIGRDPRRYKTDCQNQAQKFDTKVFVDQIKNLIETYCAGHPQKAKEDKGPAPSALAPRVSVVIPVYNGEDNLVNCLASVCNQSLSPGEIIVVDNHSTDRTKNIIQEFAQRHPHVQYLFEACRSRGAARNAGIKKAAGNIIVMTDCDCIVPRDWIEGLIKPIVAENEMVVMGHEKDLINNFWTRHIQLGNEDFITRYTDGKYISVLDSKNFAIRASLMKEFMFDSQIGNLEDFELAIRLREKHKIRYLPEIKVNHYHKSSLREWMRLNCNRGYWAIKIYKKHQGKPFVRREPMFQSLHFGNFLIWPFWLCWQFVKNPSKRIWFIFISEIGWRTGLLLGKIR